MRRSMAGAAIGVATYFGAKFMGKALLGFNASVEDSKNQIAGMLALAKKSEFTDELKTAGDLYDGLRKKAAELPGTTKDYVNMLGMLVQPLAQAGVGVQDMQDITVNTMVASRGLGEGWQKAARDVSEFINFGKMNKVDTFIRRIMEPHGWEGDAKKKELQAMTKVQRAELWKQYSNAKAIRDLGLAQSNSFSGRLDKLKDRAVMFMAKVGEGLFKALGPAMDKLDKWLGKNSKAVEAFATKLGTGLVDAFNKLREGVMWLIDHKDLVIAAIWGIIGVFTALTLRALIAWAAIAGPFLLLGAVFAGLITLFKKLEEAFGSTTAVIVTFMAAFAAYKILNMVGAIKMMTTALWGQAAATKAVTAAQGVGGIAGAARRTSGLASTAAVGGTMLGGFGAPVAKGPGGTMLGIGGVPAVAAMAAPQASAAGKRGLMTAAKAMGSAVAAAAGPIGWTLLAASFLSEMTGGDFLDQAQAKGYTGDNMFEGMQYMWKNRGGSSESGNVTNVTVNVAPTNVDITTKDADGTAAALEDAFVRKLDEAARVAGRNLGGNK